MYNLFEYGKNYRKTTGSLWNYYRDKPGDLLSSNSESFKYKTIIIGNTYNLGAGEAGCDANKIGKNEIKVVILLKHLSNFSKTLNIPLINCEIQLILAWPKKCALADKAAANNPPTGLDFQLTGTKLFVPVVTLSKENDKKNFRAINIRIWRNCKVEKIQIKNDYSTST